MLSSSRQDMNEEALVRLYWQLTEIEATFRSVKAELGMRPVFHQKDKRIQAHIWLSILAYYGVHSLRSQLKIQGCHESWSTLRKRVGHRVRLTTVYPNEEGQWVGLRRDVMPNIDEQLLYTKLGLPLSLHRRKIIQSNKA